MTQPVLDLPRGVEGGYTDRSPAFNCTPITPSDSVSLSYTARGIYVGVAGDISLVNGNGDTVLFKGVPSGYILPVQASRINSTNTTATYMVALW